MSSEFWTEKSYIPHQSHNFKVDFNLYAIKEDAFYDTGSSLGKGSLRQNSSVTAEQVEQISIPSWAVKSVDMPTLASSIQETGGNLSSENGIENRDPDYQDIQITFYAVDTPSGNIIKLLPRIFHAYYLKFTDSKATIPFQTPYDKNAPSINQYMCAHSSIIINLFKGSDPPGLAGDREENYVAYRRIAPVSYDIGNLSYDNSAIVECTMVFKYNLQDGIIGNDAGQRLGGPQRTLGTPRYS
jgi:hypothetical protein